MYKVTKKMRKELCISECELIFLSPKNQGTYIKKPILILNKKRKLNVIESLIRIVLGKEI